MCVCGGQPSSLTVGAWGACSETARRPARLGPGGEEEGAGSRGGQVPAGRVGATCEEAPLPPAPPPLGAAQGHSTATCLACPAFPEVPSRHCDEDKEDKSWDREEGSA